ncbi:hypothetical protein BT96DRAFT_915001 [Gymnopus androsaceus JB14]|uniref:Uncharacterized protein n=1 Tax=Gymnopus androsaceus JB14 TaxID=1447944 RepID=A0A6A4IDK3_9AGAR|nr:hypothetical protein BT96DRAFT_915001 [Gymnopus androsaceus JB14]
MESVWALDTFGTSPISLYVNATFSRTHALDHNGFQYFILMSQNPSKCFDWNSRYSKATKASTDTP